MDYKDELIKWYKEDAKKWRKKYVKVNRWRWFWFLLFIAGIIVFLIGMYQALEFFLMF